MRSIKTAAVAAGIAALLVLGGCGPAIVRVPQSVTRTERTYELKGAESLDAELKMDVGELRVGGGSAGAMDAEFDYRPSSWAPEVRETSEGTTARLTVEQPDAKVTMNVRNARNVWDVKLTDKVPVRLTVDRGVGKTTLMLGGMDIRRLAVSAGAGDTVIDLGSVARSDATIDVDGGVGNIVLRVPREAGVRVFGYQDGVGDFRAPGFTPRESNALYNESYDKPGVKRYDVRVQRGVGDVIIEQL